MEMNNKKLCDLINLTGKCAIITGGAQGIGAATSLRLSEAGASIMIVDINPETAKSQVQKIHSRGGKASSVQADITKIEEIQSAIKITLETFGRIDILINNAGIYPFSPILEITPDFWKRVMEVNINAVFFFSQEVSKWMKENLKEGNIINIASIAAERPGELLIHYSTSKAAVVMLTKSMALELGPYNIRVNAILPGVTVTEGSRRTQFTNDHILQILKNHIAGNPMKRIASADEIGRVALFLASELSSYMTGSMVVVDGGDLLA
jgi:2-deoxy-D-gluconate 3-dehydrogenase